jgi:hydrogenase nickel incorporation protein HypA/HybF
MHELSIAEAIISAVIREKDDRNLSGIATVGVRVGALSGVLPDALQFSFETAVEGTPLSETSLSIDRVLARGRCRDCSQQFEINDPWFKCPDCDSEQVEILSGWELDIAYLEVAKESDEESDFD